MVEESSADVWALPFKSQEFVEGPELIHSNAGLELRLDYETESGEYGWASVMFREVHAFSYTADASCTPEHVRAYDQIVEIVDGSWLRGLAGAPAGVRHFRVYFDDIGAYDVAAASIELPDLD